MSEVSPLRVVIFGCGRIAGGFNQERQSDDGKFFTHAEAYYHHDGFEIAACVEPDTARREAFMAYWKIPVGYASLNEWSSAFPDHDIASICAPTAHHADILDAVLASPVRGVLAEKPVGSDPARLSQIAANYRAAAKPLLVNYSRRFDPAMVLLRDHLAAGGAGAIRNIAVFYNKGIRNNGSHAIDLVSWLLSVPLAVLSVAKVRVDYAIDDPTVDAILTAGDVPVHLIGSDASDYSLFEITIVAERETIEIRDSGFTVHRRTVVASPDFRGYHELGPVEETATGYGQAMLHAVGQLHNAVHHGAAPVSTGESAARTLATIDAILNQTEVLQA